MFPNDNPLSGFGAGDIREAITAERRPLGRLCPLDDPPGLSPINYRRLVDMVDEARVAADEV